MQKTKPELGFMQIFNMCFGFMGIQFGFALQNANVSRIFETLGADYNNLAILWIAGPVTGLLVQPIIGHMSDKTWNKLGRRRPYFLWGALAASLALIFMPNSPYLWVAAGILPENSIPNFRACYLVPFGPQASCGQPQALPGWPKKQTVVLAFRLP